MLSPAFLFTRRWCYPAKQSSCAGLAFAASGARGSWETIPPGAKREEEDCRYLDVANEKNTHH